MSYKFSRSRDTISRSLDVLHCHLRRLLPTPSLHHRRCSHHQSSFCFFPLPVIGRYFCSYFSIHFQPNFTFHSLPHLFSFMIILTMFTFSYVLMLSCSRTKDKNTIQLVQPDTEQLDYGATDIPKQSCCAPSSPGSCAGTSSAAIKCSHHSKFWTS